MVAKAAGNTNTNTFNFGDIAWDSWSGGGGGGGGSSWGTGSVWSDTSSSNWNMDSSLLSNSTPDLSFNNNADGLLCTTPQTADYASPKDHFNSDQLMTANGYDYQTVTGSSPDTTSILANQGSGQVNGLPVTNLSGVTVSPQASVQNSGNADSEMDAAAAYTGLTGSTLDGGSLVAEHGPYGISLNWSKPAGYDALLVDNGGRMPSYVARPALEGVNISTDAAALREADYVANFGRTASLLKLGGNLLGTGGVVLDWASAIQSRDPSQMMHASVDTTVFFASMALGGPLGLALGTAWTGLDMAVQHEHYRGKQGWAAATTRYGDTVIRMRKADPGFMIEKW